jgi:transcriptional regulator with XRE-family HTH domain
MQLHGPTLRAIRKATGDLTASEAARSVGVSQPTWSNWERGTRNATARNIAAICELLGLDDPSPLVPFATSSELLRVHREIDALKDGAVA